MFSYISYAQNSADCRTAISICADESFFSFVSGYGVVEDFDPEVILQTGCLEKGIANSAAIENNTSWYVFRVGSAGTVGFDIEALPTSDEFDTIGAEWDFALYGSDVDCAAISNGMAQPIRCNYEVSSSRFTGIGINPEDGKEGAPFLVGSQNTYDEWLEVLSGELYYVIN